MLAAALVAAALVALRAGPVAAEDRASWDSVAPPVLDCTYDDGWDHFRRRLQQNAAEGWQLEGEIFDLADSLISRHLFPFLAFHRSKSNEFFYDCARDEPTGRICLYGMLSALFIHHVYLRHKIEILGTEVVSEADRSVYTDSTSVARLMLTNKNNCLDFFDSSSWPLTLDRLINVLRPPEVQPVVPLKTTGPPQAPSLPVLPAWAQKGRGATSDGGGCRVVVYITGTHAALGREPAEMLKRFAGPLLGCELEPVLEIADSTHCQYVGCEADSADADESGLESDTADASGNGGLRSGVRLANVGLNGLAAEHFIPRWGGLDISELPTFRERFAALFAAHPLSQEADILMCTSPAVLCTLLAPFERPMLAYLGEPLLLSVHKDDVDDWWGNFHALATAPGHFFACYNHFLSEMIRYQTGLSLPVVRLHGLYTGVVYAPAGSTEVLVVKGPNICLDPVCLLNRFVAAAVGSGPNGSVAAGGDGSALEPVSDISQYGRSHRGGGHAARLRFIGLDELHGAPYAKIASFRAVVFYPYDVALALFYELYSMGMPILMPFPRLLRFYVFRGLHSGGEYHRVRPGRDPGPGPAPFLAQMETQPWFEAAEYWSSWTDFARFPHLLRFGYVAEILAALQPGGADWAATTTAGMRRFNEEQLVVSAAQWAGAVAGALRASLVAS